MTTVKAKDLKVGQTIKVGWGMAFTISKIEMEPSNHLARYISCEYLHWPLYIGAETDVFLVG